MLLEAAVTPLDAARRAALQLITRSRVVTRVVAHRDTRLAWLATLQVLALFGLSLRMPVALFFLGPILFGVAHLAADVRYLALRKSPPRLLLAVSIVLAVVLTALRAVAGFGVLSGGLVERIDVALGAAWIALGCLLAMRGSKKKAALLVPPFCLGAVYAVTHAHVVTLVLVHAHNAIALVAWLLLFRRRPGWAVLPASLTVLLALLLASGVTLPFTIHHDGMSAWGTPIERIASWMAPGVDTPIAVALVTTFVFMQGVHYAVWTGWIAEDARQREGTPTYRQTVRSLIADFGVPALTVIAIGAVGLMGMALWNVRQSVAWYMNLSRSHAWFECALLAYFVTRGDFRPRGGTDVTPRAAA